MSKRKRRPSAGNTETADKLWTGSEANFNCSASFAPEGVCNG